MSVFVYRPCDHNRKQHGADRNLWGLSFPEDVPVKVTEARILALRCDFTFARLVKKIEALRGDFHQLPEETEAQEVQFFVPPKPLAPTEDEQLEAKPDRAAVIPPVKRGPGRPRKLPVSL